MAVSFRNANPALSRGFASDGARPAGGFPATTFGGPVPGDPFAADDVMTLAGTVYKTAVLLVVLVAFAVLGWSWEGLSSMAVLGLVLAAFALAVAITFRPHLARPLGVVYAALEGVAVGAISAWYAAGATRLQAGAEDVGGSGLVLGAAGLTVAILFALLAAYSTGLIRPSQNFRLGVVAATGGIMVFYLAAIVLSAFGVQVPLIWDSGPLGIVFSLFVVALASANLVLDFDFIERGVESRAPKHMEWFAAFGLLVTLVWLYLELLRLLAKLQSRD